MLKFNLLYLDGLPIFEQLQIEEALLRVDERNWCLLNTNAPSAIVMGLSAKKETLLNLPLVEKDGVPLIKRFSGGGTVYIDPNTVFVTFISNSRELNIAPFPQEIMKWSEGFYTSLFPGFSLRENDYVFGEHKFGGNAQYLQKNRFLHHTSFLWDFDREKMEYLLLPPRRPSYRQDRSHDTFLTSLKGLYQKKENLLEALRKKILQTFITQELTLASIASILAKPHRKSTTLEK